MCLDYIKINEYVDDILNLTEKLLVKDHIQSCNKCMVTYKNIKNLVKTVNNLNYPLVSDSFVHNLFLKIDNIVHPSFTELSNYRDGFSKDDIYYQTEEHVEDCYQCQTIISSINNSVNSVVSLNEYQPSENFFDNLMAKIDTLDMDDMNTDFDDSFLSGIMSKIEDLPQIDESKDFDFENIKINHISSEDLSAYLDNEDTIISVAEINEHLNSCAKCESKYLSFKKSINVTAKLDQPDVPFNFYKKVIKEVDKQEDKIIKFSPYLTRFIPRATMVAGIIIAGILVTISKIQVDPPQQNVAMNINITERSEDYLFSNSTANYKSDSLDVLLDKKQSNSLEIEDIGL